MKHGVRFDARRVLVSAACAAAFLFVGSPLLAQSSAETAAPVEPGPSTKDPSARVTQASPSNTTGSDTEQEGSGKSVPEDDGDEKNPKSDPPTGVHPLGTPSGAEMARTTEEPRRADALAMTVSGAVSLGSHEAGQLFLVTEALRQSTDSVPLRIATGASAGSANALISATEACLEGSLTAEESIGYRAWVDVGLDQLFDPERTTRQSIFYSDALERSYGYLEKLWAQGLSGQCDFAYGVAVTRRPPEDMKLAEGLVIARSAERFVVRIDGGRSGAPRFFNYVDEKTNHNRPLLPFSGDFKDDANALRPVVLASAAFPVAFSPQPIQYCVSGQTDADNQCPEPTRVDQFVDGGVFDNNPLGIAYRTAQAGLVKRGSLVTLRDQPDGRNPSEVDVLYGFVDPDLRSYPLYYPPPAEHDATDDPVMSLVTRLGGQMLQNARGNQLASLADENFGLLEDLWLINANYPPISELLGAFFGFFEHDFRDFDFHLGTHDSFVDLRNGSAVRLGAQEYIERLDAVLQGQAKAVPQRYRKLACIASHLGQKKYRHLSDTCRGEDMRNFRVLLQVTIDRLWSNCRLLSSEQVAATDHVGCKQAQGGLPPPVVDASFSVVGSRYQERKESQFDYTLRLLSGYGFHFRDLGLSPAEADRARVSVRRKLIAMVEALSKAQGAYLDRTAVMTAGRTLINQIYYEPPKKRAYVGVGSSIFAGYLGRLGDSRLWYWNPDVRMLNFRELLTDGDFRFSAQASLGLELAFLPLSGSVWQTSVGLRGGYQFAGDDGIGFESCESDQAAGDSRRCSGPVVHTPLNFTLLERVRFALTPVFYPLPRDFGHKWFELEIGIGAELF